MEAGAHGVRGGFELESFPLAGRPSAQTRLEIPGLAHCFGHAGLGMLDPKWGTKMEEVESEGVDIMVAFGRQQIHAH